MTSPEPPSNQNNFKSLLIKGVISATALAGTTAIPLLVQRSLQTPPPPAANATPTPSITTTTTPSPQVSPSLASPPMTTPATSQQNIDQDNSGKKPKKKN